MKEKSKKLYKLIFPVILGITLLIGISYAWFTLTLNGTKTNVLKAGTLTVNFSDTSSSGISILGTAPVTDKIGLTQTPYSFTLTNNGADESEYTIYLDDVALLTGESRLSNSAIKYNLVKDGVTVATELLSETGTNPNRILDTGIIPAGKSYTYKLKLWVDYDATIEEANKTFRGKIRVVASQAIERIVAVYKYDQTNNATKCITGEESTCEKITPTTYEKGTIVKYQVNDSETKYFYVLHDDGDTLTMQQRENTTTAAWYSTADNTQGPTTAIAALEAATSSWTNVNDQTYTMGTTIFGSASNAYTGCSSSGCTTNKYTWSEKTAKARMITFQEANDQGCTTSTRSCPIYMYNYLSNSTNNGGTVNGSSGYYWTMSTEATSSYAYFAFSNGGLVNQAVQYSGGLRAVVVIDK